MRLGDDIEIGVATHTGVVRSSNEDDYLVMAPEEEADGPARGRLLAVADGMGGVVGGAEASRAAVRALAGALLQAYSGQPTEERMAAGFGAACSRVYELSREMPALREMGTTLTAIHLADGRAVLGHVGDSRALLVRDGELRRLTTDHAVREADNYLTRCIGGGQATEEPDLETLELAAGDCLVLLTDGLWSTVGEDAIRDVVVRMRPQKAAEHLVRLANDAGGHDNSTVIIARLREPSDEARLRELELPREEQRGPRRAVRSDGSLTPPRWPWLVWALAVALGLAAVLRIVAGVDLLRLVVDWLSG